MRYKVFILLNNIVMGKFKELLVWQRAKDLAVYIYKMSRDGELSKDYGLRDQMRRAAVSIPSNIAEGDELDTNKQAVKHFYYSKGSSAELLTQTIIAYEVGFISHEELMDIENECLSISRMLQKLILARRGWV